MLIYACKRLIFAPKCPKYDPIVLNKCVQHCQLRTNNTPTGVVVSAMHATNSLYGSCATTHIASNYTAVVHAVVLLPCCYYFHRSRVCAWCTANCTTPFRSF